MKKNTLWRVVLLGILLAALSWMLHYRSPRYYREFFERANVSVTRAAPAKKAPPSESVAVSSSYLIPGEQIVYEVMLGKIPLGEAKFIDKGEVTMDGRTVHHISFQTRLMSFSDTEEIFFDPFTLLPLKVQRDIKMFPLPEKIVEHYDQKQFLLTIEKTKLMKKHTLTMHKDSSIQNAVLLPYLVRTIPDLSSGWSEAINLPTQRFMITLAGEETITVPAGTFNAFHFTSDPRRFEIWVSNDKNRLPLQIKGVGGLGYRMEMKERSVP